MTDTEKKIAEIREVLEKIDRGDLFEIAMAHEKSGEWLRFLLDELERKDEVIEEQKRQLFYKSQEITELREKSWQDQQWFKQASANITEMQKELERIEREYAEERAAHNAHVTELCELEQERDKLIECLRFYERLARGREINDGGRRARTLLAEIGVVGDV